MKAKSVFNEILKKRRKEKKMTQDDISKALGITKRSYQRFESGAPALNTYAECMRILDLKVILVREEEII